MGSPGYDDAPLARLRMGDPKPVTLVVPYYDNPQFLAKQVGLWNSYPDVIRSLLRVIVVDDGSLETCALSVLTDLPTAFALRLFRIDVDNRWGWLAARNIGMHYATEGWCVTTDIDHMLPVETLTNLQNQAHDPTVIYRFSRREHTGQTIHCHPNSQFMTRAMFWKIGGYDERMVGYYGSDGFWRRRCAATAPVLTLPDPLERHEHQGDSSTRKYKRKQPEDARLKQIVKAFPKGSKPTHLTFTYHECPL